MDITTLHDLFELREGGRLFVRRRSSPTSHSVIGTEAGRVHSKGYRQVSIAGKRYYTHRIVFAMTQGRWPVGEIDHINRDKTDNRPENLRDVTRAQNAWNRGLSAMNRSGAIGVTATRAGKWAAKIERNGVVTNLGVFDDKSAAAMAYANAAHELGAQPRRS